MATIRRDLFLFITAFWALFSYQEVVKRVVVAWCSLCSSRHFIILIIGSFHFRDSINFSFQTTLCHYYTLAPDMIIRHTVIVKKMLRSLSIILTLEILFCFFCLCARRLLCPYTLNSLQFVQYTVDSNLSWTAFAYMYNLNAHASFLLKVKSWVRIKPNFQYPQLLSYAMNGIRT